MRILARQEFMKLPEGTIFASGGRCYFDGFFVKGETWETDFLCRSLNIFDASGTDDFVGGFDEMVAGASRPIEQCYGREGLFDDEMLYLVYEPADIAELIRVLQAAPQTQKGPPSS